MAEAQTAPVAAPPGSAWMFEPGRRSRLALAGVVLVALFLVVVALDARRFGHLDNGDSNNLVAGARFALDCVRDGDFVGCGRFEGSVQTAVFPYPLLQYIPATFFVWLEWDDGSILSALRWLNAASLVAMLFVAWKVLARRPRVALLGCAAILGSSLLYQANSAFGESFAALAVVGAVAAAIRRRPLLLGCLALVACTAKETFGPFVLVLCLLCAREAHDRLLPARRLTVAAILGCSAGMLAGVLFNVFRFGSARNILYLQEHFRTDGLDRQLEFFAALWVSPAGGLLFFWPIAVVILCTASGLAARRLISRDLAFGLPLALVALTAAGFTAGLALWYSPFGWITFGPRLAVPLIPGLVVTVLHLAGEEVVDLLGRSRVRASLVVVGLTLAAAPMMGSPWRWLPAVLEMIRPGEASCPAMTGLAVHEDPETYYRCTSGTMWRMRPQILDDTFDVSWSLAGLGWIVGTAAVSLLLLSALWPTSTSDDDPPPSRDSAGGVLRPSNPSLR